MVVGVRNQQKKIRFDPNSVRRAARRLLTYLGLEESELSILLVDDATMATLNQTYRGKSGPTDVLSFALREGEFGEINPSLLGDIVISLETADRQAQAAGHSLQTEVRLLLIHGLLHLLGYDHERSLQEAEEMREKETELLALFR
ncbi:MAG: rRNA maturation RNase YbeY [Nitrospinota bacterium]|nr:MAG: rRNA maturation RNase YbeY [Nitrospinota bacterium]